MTDPWVEPLMELERLDQRLESIRLLDFASAAKLLADRRTVLAVVENLALRTGAPPAAGLLRRIEKSAAFGTTFRFHLLSEIASLRERIAQGRRFRALARTILPDAAGPKGRLSCSG